MLKTTADDFLRELEQACDWLNIERGRARDYVRLLEEFHRRGRRPEHVLAYYEAYDIVELFELWDTDSRPAGPAGAFSSRSCVLSHGWQIQRMSSTVRLRLSVPHPEQSPLPRTPCSSSLTPDEPTQYPRQPRKQAARRGFSPIPRRHGSRPRAPQPSLCAPGLALERPVPAAQLLRHIPRVHPRVALAHELFVDHRVLFLAFPRGIPPGIDRIVP